MGHLMLKFNTSGTIFFFNKIYGKGVPFLSTREYVKIIGGLTPGRSLSVQTFAAATAERNKRWGVGVGEEG